MRRVAFLVWFSVREQRAALRALADLSRKKNAREEVTSLVVAEADRLIAISDDKARKTAYMLIGLCAPDACADKPCSGAEERTDTVRTPFGLYWRWVIQQHPADILTVT